MTDTTTFAQALNNTLYEIISIAVYNIVVLKIQDSTKIFVAPLEKSDREAITKVLKLKTNRKSILTKPRSAKSDTKAGPKTKKAPPKITNVPAAVSISYKQFKFEVDNRPKSQAAGALVIQRFTKASAPSASALLKNDLVANKLAIFQLTNNDNTTTEIFTYKKATKYHVLGACVFDTVTKNRHYLNLLHLEDDTDIAKFTVIKNKSIIIPNLFYPDKKSLTKLYENIFES